MAFLEVDYREHKIIELLKKTDIKHSVINLPIGDFIIKNNNTKVIEFIIERKSIEDLCASITDNRFREQKQRLLDSVNNPQKIIYIIEGKKIQSKFTRITTKTINSAILNLMFKHKYHVIYTDNPEDTLENIMLLLSKIQKNELELQCIQPGFVEKLIKKSDKHNENIFVNQLGVINGVSLLVANKIKEQYSCMNDLIKAFHEKGNELLSDIQLDKRKIGKVLSVKIYNCLIKNE